MGDLYGSMEVSNTIQEVAIKMGVAIQYRTFYFNFYHDFNEGIKLFRGMLTKIEHFYRLYDSDFPPVVPIKNTFLYVLIFEI